MNVALAKTETERAVNGVFAVARVRLSGSPTVAEVRNQAFEAFERAGLPNRRIEEWKYTDLRALMREVLPLAPAPDADAIKHARATLKTVGVKGATRLVLVDGAFVSELSDAAEAGVNVTTLREALEGGDGKLLATDATDAMISLNAAMATDGVIISVTGDANLTKPMQIIHVTTATKASTFTRSHLSIGNGARVTLVESFVAAEGAKAYQVNDAVILSIGDDAELAHVRLMADAPDAANITSGMFTVGARADYDLFNMTSGGAISRFSGLVTLKGEGSDLNVNGVNLLKGTQHGDTTLVVDHAVPNCTSREIFRAVVDDRAHSVFQGRIIVRPNAQKTDGKMMTRALLLSDEAEADNKPELEIFADDVTCGHGATSGALDETLLFYLRARGLSEKEAQALLIQAFLGEAIEQIGNDELRDYASSLAQHWLEARA
jgi:Fe-S cluster assembly protein SufD